MWELLLRLYHLRLLLLSFTRCYGGGGGAGSGDREEGMILLRRRRWGFCNDRCGSTPGESIDETIPEIFTFIDQTVPEIFGFGATPIDESVNFLCTERLYSGSSSTYSSRRNVPNRLNNLRG